MVFHVKQHGKSNGQGGAWKYERAQASPRRLPIRGGEEGQDGRKKGCNGKLKDVGGRAFVGFRGLGRQKEAAEDCEEGYEREDDCGDGGGTVDFAGAGTVIVSFVACRRLNLVQVIFHSFILF